MSYNNSDIEKLSNMQIADMMQVCLSFESKLDLLDEDVLAEAAERLCNEDDKMKDELKAGILQ